MIRAKAFLACASHWIISSYLLSLLVCDKGYTINLMFTEDLGFSASHSELFLPFNRNSLENGQPSGYPVLPFGNFQPSCWNLAWCNISWLYFMKKCGTKHLWIEVDNSEKWKREIHIYEFIKVFQALADCEMDSHSLLSYFCWVCCIQGC